MFSGRAGLEKRHAIFSAGGENTFARLFSFRADTGRAGLTNNRAPGPKSPGPKFGEAEPRHGEDLLAMGDPLRAFELDARAAVRRWG